MAKCKICKTNIPDGTEFCSDCQDKKNVAANESYLDSLLSSVKNTVPVESIYRKKRNSEPGANSDSDKKITISEKDNNQLPEPNLNDYISYKVDLGDIKDFDQFFQEDDFNDIRDSGIISDKELFGKDINDIINEIPVNVPDKKPGELNTADQSALNELTDSDSYSEPGSEDVPVKDEVYYSDEDQAEQIEEEELPEESPDYNFNTNEISELETEEDFDADLNDLLNSLDTFETADPENAGTDEEEPKPATMSEIEPAEDDKVGQAEQDEEDNLELRDQEDDFLALLNQISSDDPVAGDVKVINDLLTGTAPIIKKESELPSDVGEVFSDALKVVSSLNDGEEQAILDIIPDKVEKKNKKKAKIEASEKIKKSKKDKPEEGLEQSKPGLFQRLFGNVKDEKAPAPKKKTTTEKPAVEAEAAKDTGKKSKVKKPKKGAPVPEEEEGAEGSKGGKGKAAASKEKKQDKKEKKKKTKEIIQVIDEIEEDEGRINRLGAVIVFVFFGLLTALLLVGTNIVSYSISIQNATNYFERKKYTEAYNEVYGMDINDEDIEVYDKIMTVMFVNKQLNSYNGYYSLEMYPEALDSLLKGLKRYDKYIKLATALGIETDLDYVRNQILAELENEFGLSEKDAIKINSYTDMKEYSKEVYNVVLENMNH